MRPFTAIENDITPLLYEQLDPTSFKLYFLLRQLATARMLPVVQSNQELANTLHVSLRHVERSIGKLKEHGLIERSSRRAITIADTATLVGDTATDGGSTDPTDDQSPYNLAEPPPLTTDEPPHMAGNPTEALTSDGGATATGGGANRHIWRDNTPETPADKAIPEALRTKKLTDVVVGLLVSDRRERVAFLMRWVAEKEACDLVDQHPERTDLPFLRMLQAHLKRDAEKIKSPKGIVRFAITTGDFEVPEDLRATMESQRNRRHARAELRSAEHDEDTGVQKAEAKFDPDHWATHHLPEDKAPLLGKDPPSECSVCGGTEFVQDAINLRLGYLSKSWKCVSCKPHTPAVVARAVNGEVTEKATRRFGIAEALRSAETENRTLSEAKS